MTSSARMHHTPTNDMFVSVGELSMVGFPHAAAKSEARTSELSANANIEGDVAVVGVHVEAQVLIRTVSDNKGVVVIKRNGLSRELATAQRVQHTLHQTREHFIKAHIVENHPIVVHTVRTMSREAGGIKVVQLHQHVGAKLWCEHRKREYVFRMLRKESLLRHFASKEFSQLRSKPRILHFSEELREAALGRVSGDGFSPLSVVPGTVKIS
mmetsp:Transcript_12836/g.27588  ORF Transcript_12836/g.27588 Transcript_12836/m.27588 type:complete len:212 (+) Transcript_12836:297-932(+)